MVRMEQPGEALRLFNAAERGGLSPGEFAADRGLAYDLLGAPQLAQRGLTHRRAVKLGDERLDRQSRGRRCRDERL